MLNRLLKTPVSTRDQLRQELRSLLLAHDPTALIEAMAEEYNLLPAEARHSRRADLRILSPEFIAGAYD